MKFKKGDKITLKDYSPDLDHRRRKGQVAIVDCEYIGAEDWIIKWRDGHLTVTNESNMVLYQDYDARLI